MNRIVGITGGIACGKSVCGRVLQSLGVAVLDTDQVAHAVMKKGEAAYGPVVEAFGSGVLDDDGEIDRKKLGLLVFADEAQRRQLNELVHPPVQVQWESWRDAQVTSVAVLIPLLFEVGATEGWDAIVCIASQERLMRARMKERGLDEASIQQRLDAQWPIEKKAANADVVIWNNGSLKTFEQSITEWWQKFNNEET
jgi:dephospho-CoA kinase